MTDEQRGDWAWPAMITLYRCSVCGFGRHQGLCGCSPDEPPLVARDYAPAPVSPVVPLTAVRDWIAQRALRDRPPHDDLAELAVLLDKYDGSA